MLHGYKVWLDFVDKAQNVKLPQKAVSKGYWCSKRSFCFNKSGWKRLIYLQLNYYFGGGLIGVECSRN